MLMLKMVYSFSQQEYLEKINKCIIITSTYVCVCVCVCVFYCALLFKDIKCFLLEWSMTIRELLSREDLYDTPIHNSCMCLYD